MSTPDTKKRHAFLNDGSWEVLSPIKVIKRLQVDTLLIGAFILLKIPLGLYLYFQIPKYP